MNKKRTLQLFYGAVMLLFLGLIYGWSVFVTPLEVEFGWARSASSLVFTFSMIFFCLGGFASGLLLRKHSHRFVLRIAAGCLLAGFFASSFVQSIWGIYISYGVLCGSGVGLGYNAILGTISKWFPDKPGLCSGILLLGFGTGALLLSAGATALIGAFGWRTTFIVFSVLFALVIFFGALLLRMPSEEDVKKLPARTLAEGEAEYAPAQMVRRFSFWMLFVWSTVLAAVGLAVIGQAAPIALELGVSTAFATTATGIISVCNGLSRLVTGGLFDKLGRKKTMLVVSGLFFVAMPLLFLAMRAGSPVLLIVGFVVLGFGFGGVPPTLSATLLRLYGQRHYALNFGVLNFNIILSAIAGPLAASSIQEATNSYELAFLVLLVFCVPAVFSALFIKKA